ncbi:chemotaxis protein CheD [Alteromonadaceae bacterium 2753L.S.0a.02]|nr:chemotaxis protein CheD [Alteromonadaceae bacterium 2753L.S.0a.02]
MKNRGDAIIISPGEWHVGYSPQYISTLLGSCVAVTAWHSRLHCGGMCHYLLPHKSPHKELAPAKHPGLNPRYGVDALALLSAQLMQHAALHEYTFGYFGGATMFKGNHRIGEANCELAINWLRNNNLQIQDISIGGVRGRKIILDLETGKIIATEFNTVVVGETDGHQCLGSG